MPEATNRSRQYRYAFAALMLTVCAVFWRHLFTSDVLFYRDISFASFPRLLEMRNIVRSGTLPLWNPFEHFGEPVATNPNYLLFYPTTWLAWLLPAAYAFKLHFVLHFAMLAAGAFLLARRARLGPVAAYFAGAFFVLSGPLMSLGSFYNAIAAAAWMPFVLLAADSLVRPDAAGGDTSSPRTRCALLGGAFAMQIFAGEPFISVMTAALVVFWCAGRWWDASRLRKSGLLEIRNPQSAIRNSSKLAIAFCVATGLAAVQLLPAAWHLRHTARAQLPYEHAFYWSLNPLKLLEVVVPRIWGDQFSHFRLPWLYLEGREPFLLSVFIGLVPLALAGVALLLRRDRLTWFWAIAGAVCLVLALGSYTPLGWLFYYAIPLFRVFRFPVKFTIPLALAVAQMAAIGIDALLRSQRTIRDEDTTDRTKRSLVPLWWVLETALLAFGALWTLATALIVLAPAAAQNLALALSRAVFTKDFVERNAQTLAMDQAEAVERAALWLREAIPTRLPYVLLAVGVLAVIVHLVRTGLPREGDKRGRLSPPAVAALVLFAAGSAVVQLTVNHYGLVPVVDARYFRDPPPLLASLPAREAPLRVFAEPLAPGSMPTAVLGQELDFLPPAAQFNYAQRFSLMWGAGANGVETTFTLDPEIVLEAPHAEMQRFVYKVGQYWPIGRLLAAGSVDWALLPGGASNPGPGYQQVGLFADPRQYPVRAFRLSQAVPRAYLVAPRAVEIRPVGPGAIERLVSPGFDLRRQVLLERHAFSDAQIQAATRSLSEVAGEARIVRRSATRVEIETHEPEPAYLVLTDSYSPDWRASVDGEDVPLLRANQIFRAVPVPAGVHRVVFAYRPAPLYYGALLTLATALFAAAMAARERRQAKPLPEQAAAPKSS